MAVGAIVGGEIALLAAYGTGAPFGLLVLVPLVGCVYTAAGILAWIRRPANRMGPLLCVGGLVWLAASTVNIAIPAFIAVGSVTQTLPTALAVHALLAYPSGRLRTPASRVLTIARLRCDVGAPSPAVPVRRRRGRIRPCCWWPTVPTWSRSGNGSRVLPASLILVATGALLIRGWSPPTAGIGGCCCRCTDAAPWCWWG